jgi:hypothetical protein
MKPLKPKPVERDWKRGPLAKQTLVGGKPAPKETSQKIQKET